MMGKVPNQQSIDIQPIPFQNTLSTYDPENDQIENIEKNLVSLQPISPLHYVVYPILEAKPPTTFNWLIYSIHRITVERLHLDMILSSSFEKPY